MIQTNEKGQELELVTAMNTHTHTHKRVWEEREREALPQKSFLESDEL